MAEHVSDKLKNIVFHKNEMRPMIRSSGTIFRVYSPVYFNSRRGYSKLKTLYLAISVKIDSLSANTGAQQAEGL